MRGGMWRSRALFRIAVSGVRRNTYTPVPVGKLRLSWFRLQPVHAASAKNGPYNTLFISNMLQYSALAA